MMSEKTAILIRPRHIFHDDPTEFSYKWAETVKQALESKNWKVIDLAESNAIREKLEETKNAEKQLLIFYGHGENDKMIGQNSQAIVNIDNIYILENLTVYVMSCLTTQKLGKKSENIARCYLGYDDRIFVWLSPDYVENLGKCVNKGILEMLNIPTYTIKQAQQAIINEYNQWIDYFAIGEGANSQQKIKFAADLRHNRDALKLFGNTSATLI